MTFQRLTQSLVGLQIPEEDDAIPAAGGQNVAVRADGQADHGVRSGVKGLIALGPISASAIPIFDGSEFGQHLSVLQIPQRNDAAIRACQNSAVPVEGHTFNSPSLSFQGWPQGLAGIQVPK